MSLWTLRWGSSLGALLVLLSVLPAGAAEAEDKAAADVVVIVDTSLSMKEPGMDPERTSLLVAKLFSDIVPGDLAVVRLLDLEGDKNLLPSRGTGRMKPCEEDPTRQCEVVEQATDWMAEARSGRLGTLVRPSRGDAVYKQSLDGHLAQVANNSLFGLGFAAAQGVFDQHGARDVPRAVVWLSDGRAEDPQPLTTAIAEMTAASTVVEAVVFGRGDPSLARAAGLEVRQAASPAQLMQAFAGAFRRIVQAPYEIDNEVAVEPRFEMKPDVREAWIVVYGDDTLSGVALAGPRGAVGADYARDSQPGAGAYRVAYLERPAAGTWTVEAQGGGPGVAFAVVQRSALAPVLLAPKTAVAATRMQLVAGLGSGSGSLVTEPRILGETRISAFVEGRWIDLADDGAGGDAKARDGRFSGWTTFATVGKARVRVRASSPLLQREVEATVEVSGRFESAGPVAVDLGTLKAGGAACRPLRLGGRHQGAVPFELRRLRRLPSGHALELRLPGAELQPGDSALPIAPRDAIEVCLETSQRAASTAAAGERWLELRVAGTADALHAVPLELRWRVEGLTFWERWGWLILLILGVLLGLFVILGFVLPKRFQSALAVAFVPDRRELDEQTPEPVTQWKGVGIGFYRSARAFLHASFRLNGNPRGALAGLFAEAVGTWVRPGRGTSLFRETLDGDWESLGADGRRARSGDVYRIGESGPYFRISSRAGRG